jgi:hypothetical protein
MNLPGEKYAANSCHVISVNDVPAEREFLVWIVGPKTSVEWPMWKIFSLLSSGMVYMAEGITG